MIHTAKDAKTYRRRLKRALENTFLKQTLANFSAAYKTARENAYAGLDFEVLRREIAAGKDATLPMLQQQFDRFREHAQAAGMTVHTAETAADANRIIAGIAERTGVREIVKSKSMTAEEIFLNDHLLSRGFAVTETDLGEWIVQRRGEHPSHMVLPAIHLSRREAAALFADLVDTPVDPDDIGGMVEIARNTLRRKFLEADMGITGANFAVADTGTLGLITNEGNARLVTTMPRVHVALVGYDKLVPDLSAALRLLRVIPRNGTGQLISSYVTWITGNPPFDPGGGGKETHVVFLDNGRLALAADPVFSEALRCVRCGACANVCPIYTSVGGHNYGHVYIGAIGLILTLFYHGEENARTIVNNCLNCLACKSVCPADIDLPHLIKKATGEVHRRVGKKPVKNRALASIMKNRRLFHFLLRKAYLAQKPFSDADGLIRHLPFVFTAEHRFRSIPRLAKTPLRDQFAARVTKVSTPKYRVALFGGCAVDFIYPEQGKAFLDLMGRFSVQVEYPLSQTCCGLPLLMAAEEPVAREVARQNLSAFSPDRYDFIVTLCASCASHLKENYPKLLAAENPPETLPMFTEKVIDFSSFFADHLASESAAFRGRGRKVAYHAPCHLCRGLGVTRAPKTLLHAAGLEYTAYPDEDVCCGFAGSYSVDFPEISAEILGRKLDRVAASGASELVTDCPGCVLQLRGGADKRGLPIGVRHIAECVLEELL